MHTFYEPTKLASSRWKYPLKFRRKTLFTTQSAEDPLANFMENIQCKLKYTKNNTSDIIGSLITVELLQRIRKHRPNNSTSGGHFISSTADRDEGGGKPAPPPLLRKFHTIFDKNNINQYT